MTDFIPETPESPTIGERLREAREAKKLSLEDVASQTRIPVRHLQNIEREEWDALPASTYCVGFVRAYGNAVGLDGPELGRELRARLGGVTRRPVADAYEPADPARVPPRSLALVAALAAALLIVGYMIWRSSLDDEPGAETAPAQRTAPAPAAQPAPPPQPAGQVTLVATAESWVRIDQPGGPALFQGTLLAGQRFDVPAAAQNPVIRTGRPNVIRVLIGGRDIGPLDPVERTITDVSLRAADLVARPTAPAVAPAVPSARTTSARPIRAPSRQAPPRQVPPPPQNEPVPAPAPITPQ